MHPGWVSQIHSHNQTSSTSIDGDQWTSPRTQIPDSSLSPQPPPELSLGPVEIGLLAVPTPPPPPPSLRSPRSPRRTPTPTHPSQAQRLLTININPGDHEVIHTDASDEEMESVHPGYGSTASGYNNQQKKSNLMNTSEIPSPINNLGASGSVDGEVPGGDGIERMRIRLKYYFMNPLEKWETRRQFPYKLTLQLIKIIFVTLQLVLFGSYRYASVNYVYDNKISFSHLFLKDWDSGREITSYPPNTGALAVYTKQGFFDYVNHAVDAYGKIRNTSIGPYFYDRANGSPSPINLCLEEYVKGSIFSFNETFIFDSRTDTKCLDIPLNPEPFSLKSFLQQNNMTIDFVTLLETDLKFKLKTVRFRDLGPLKSPDCFIFEIKISFANRDHDGQVLVDLEANPVKFDCKGTTEFKSDKLDAVGRSTLNYTVIIISILSMFLCCRAIYRAQLLKAETVALFRTNFGKDLTIAERLQFLNGWYILIIFNDILIIIGSAIKEEIENKELHGDSWNVCSVCLGVGNLLVWFGVLRYLGFFRTYNVLILTLKRASPNVIRFLLCAVLIYAGFTFCGWLILGPYHMKFSSLSTTSECLFALINGDDMFATFAAMNNRSLFLWWFCRIYLYTFISLFIYVVLSLFIALIMDAYETIKLYYAEGFPRTALEEFLSGQNDLNTTASSSFTTHGGTGGPESTSQNIIFPPCHHYHHHHPMSESSNSQQHQPISRRISAAGMLDTILENICGCSSPVPMPNRDTTSIHEQNTEDEPLIAA